MENGVLAAIFALWALLSLEGDAPFAKHPMDTSWTVAVGETFFQRDRNGSELRLEYHRDHRFGPLQPTFDVSVTERGGVYLGSGFRQEAVIGGPFYLAGSGVTGIWLNRSFGDHDEDLGGWLEFRTTFEVGAEIGPGQVGIAWDHRSNAGFGRINPGLEVLSLRYTMSF